MLGKEDTYKPFANPLRELPEVGDKYSLNKDEKWFYNFLDQLDNRVGVKGYDRPLPAIKKTS